GLGTFRPVTVENIEDHHMHSEYYVFSQESANKLNTIKQKGGKIISVGTTSTRVLETVMRDNNGVFKEKYGWTDIYIYPPYEYNTLIKIHIYNKTMNKMHLINVKQTLICTNHQ